MPVLQLDRVERVCCCTLNVFIEVLHFRLPQQAYLYPRHAHLMFVGVCAETEMPNPPESTITESQTARLISSSSPAQSSVQSVHCMRTIRDDLVHQSANFRHCCLSAIIQHRLGRRFVRPPWPVLRRLSQRPCGTCQSWPRDPVGRMGVRLNEGCT